MPTLICPFHGFLSPFPYKDKQQIIHFFRVTWKDSKIAITIIEKAKKKETVFKCRHIKSLASEATIVFIYVLVKEVGDSI